MNVPPPLPQSPSSKRRRPFLIFGTIAVVLLTLVVLGYLAVRSVMHSGITKVPDNLFGDQHLKTAVALVELQKIRYGSYPETLRDLKFIGEWDAIALQSVDYHPNPDHTAYYLEVQRGWIGKPTLEMPEEFWLGTGYSKSLKPRTD